MKYLVLGAGGMAGHMITVFLLEQRENVVGVARRNLRYCQTVCMDVTDFNNLEQLIVNGNYDIVVNCIGKLNQSAETDVCQAIKLNSYLPHFLAKVCKDTNTKIIHISTDCIFSGEKGNYKENDMPDAVSYYARTKALGELKDDKNLTIRTSIIGPDINEKGIGLFHWYMQQSEKICGFKRSIWSGVTTLTLAKAIYKIAYSNITGVYHLTNNRAISKYELLKLFRDKDSLKYEIEEVDGAVYDKSFINSRKDIAFRVPSYDEQVKEMFDWIKSHRELYSLPMYQRIVDTSGGGV